MTTACRAHKNNRYKKIFSFISKDSATEILLIHSRYGHLGFDLIYINGNPNPALLCKDILNCQSLAHPGTLVWVNNYSADVKKIFNANKIQIFLVEHKNKLGLLRMTTLI
jgi:hypothetical protein